MFLGQFLLTHFYQSFKTGFFCAYVCCITPGWSAEYSKRKEWIHSPSAINSEMVVNFIHPNSGEH